MKIRSFIKILFVNTLILGFLLILSDVLLTSFRKHKSARRISAVYHHGFVPNANLSEAWLKGHLIKEKINRFGFKSTQSDKKVISLSEYKTVVIGDSFAEGIGVKYTEAFASLLSKEFSPVANMGVISYSPSLYKAKLSYYKKRGLNPEVLIQIIDVSDIQDEYLYNLEGFRSTPVPSFIEHSRLTKTFTYKFFTRLIWHLNSKNPLRLTRIMINSPEDIKIRDPYSLKRTPYYYEEGKKSLLKAIKESIDLYPEARHYAFAYNWGKNKMTTNGEKLYKQYISDLSILINSYSNSTFCDMKDIVEYPKGYIEGDYHWNQLGNQQIANRFLEDCFSK